MDTSDQATVATGRRRRSAADERGEAEIVAEAMVPGASVAAVARKHGVNANLLFGWRRLHKRGLLEQCREPASLLPVTVTTPTVAADARAVRAPCVPAVAPTGVRATGAPRVTSRSSCRGDVGCACTGRVERAVRSSRCWTALPQPMIALPAGVQVWLAAGATDMRKGFDGLAALVQTQLAEDPFSGQLFVFRGRRGDRVKILWWDGDGMCLFAKRLERGRFVWPQATQRHGEL